MEIIGPKKRKFQFCFLHSFCFLSFNSFKTQKEMHVFIIVSYRNSEILGGIECFLEISNPFRPFQTFRSRKGKWNCRQMRQVASFTTASLAPPTRSASTSTARTTRSSTAREPSRSRPLPPSSHLSYCSSNNGWTIVNINYVNHCTHRL